MQHSTPESERLLVKFFGIWWRDALHRLALRYCDALFERDRDLWVVQYEGEDFQGGWWPMSELHHSKSAAVRSASQRARHATNRNIYVLQIPVGLGTAISGTTT